MKLSDFSLSLRITAGALITVAVSAVTLLIIENVRDRDVYLNEQHAHLEKALESEELRLNQTINTLRQDVLFLSNAPPVSGIVRAALNHGYDPRYGNTHKVWAERLQQIFSAFSKAHPDYYKIRFIGVADGGREIVRIDNRGGKIEITSSDRLQAKGDRDFFKATLGLHEGQVHLSKFNLNQDWGVIEQPYWPTLRAATPVFTPSGKIFGMVMINIDANNLLKPSVLSLPQNTQAYIANGDGQYLLHPDSQRAFAFELGSKDNIATDFPGLKMMLNPQAAEYMPPRVIATGTGSALIAAKRIHLDSNDPARFLFLMYSIPDTVVAQHIPMMPLKNIIGGFMAMLLVGGIALLVLRRTFAPLEQIAAAADRIAAGDCDILLPQVGGGEIGSLTNALNTMLFKLSQREQEILRINVGLEERVRERTKELEQAQIETMAMLRRYKTLMLASMDGIHIMDTQGNLVEANDAFCSMLGYTLEEMAGLNVAEWEAQYSADQLRRGFKTLFGKSHLFETLHRRKDGTLINVEVSVNGVEMEGLGLLFASSRDITERKRNEERIQQSEGMLRTIIGTIHDLIWLKDPNGIYLACNLMFERFFGAKEAEIIGKTDYDFVDKELADFFREHDRKAMANGGSSVNEEWVTFADDGHRALLETVKTPTYDKSGQLIGVLGIARDITERKRTEEELRIAAIAFETQEGMTVTDAHGVILRVNHAFTDITGYTAEEVIGQTPRLLKSGRHDAAFYAAMWESIQRAGVWKGEIWNRRKNGEVYPEYHSITAVKGGNGEITHYVGAMNDITERKRTEAEIIATKNQLQATMEAIPDLLFEVGLDGRFYDYHAPRNDLLAAPPEVFLGKTIHEVIPPDAAKTCMSALQEASEQGWSTGKEVALHLPQGERWFELSVASKRESDGQDRRFIFLSRDITERKKAEQEIHNLAFYDALTKLPNRRLFLDRFCTALPVSARYNNYGAVLFIDLDRFKLLNDTLGHDYGDLLLIEVAVRVKACVREMDTVARLGGDEFVVLIEGVSDNQDEASYKVGLIAEKIRESLARPYSLNGHEHHSSPSIGVCLYLGNEEAVEELLQHADMAMYQAKDSGRNAVRFFDPVMQNNVATRAALVNDLRSAIAHQQLHLHYQLQVDNDNHPVGAEALLRWIHPQRGMVMPEQFLPIAEESTLILDVGDWVLETACQQLVLWSANEKMRDLVLTVNVSAKQFAMPDFVDKVASTLRTHQINPARLKLELTESMALDDLPSAVEKMHALKALGACLSMDDFGTRYSSLSNLKQLPLDQIKLGRSFVQDIASDGNVALLVQSIIDLSSKYRITVIAEGVENEAQLTSLRDRDCVAYQGFLFSKALSIEEFEQLLNRS